MKIFMISPLPPPIGGISRWTEMILEKSTSDLDLEIDILDIAPKWKPIGSGVLLRIIGGLFQLLRDVVIFIIRMLKNPNVVHINTSGGFSINRDIIFITISLLFKKSVIYHIHHGQYSNDISKYMKIVLACLSKTVKCIIVLDNKTYYNLKNINIKNLIKIPNFISIYNKTIEKKIKKIIIVYVGWIVKTKGIEELIKSFNIINNNQWQLLIIGPQDESFVKYLKNKYKFKNIKIIKPLKHKHIMNILLTSSIFVLPSYTEGFPNVILEAMLCKSAIISTNVGAIPEIITEKCGILIKPKDVIELTTAIITMINSNKLRLKYTNNALERLKNNYTLDIIYNKYKNIWFEKNINI